MYQKLSPENNMYDSEVRTLTRSFFGCFLSNLLHASMADLFEPVSSASIYVEHSEENYVYDHESPFPEMSSQYDERTINWA